MRHFGYGRVSNWERKVKSINLSVLDFVWENRSLMEFWLGSSKSQIFGMFLKRRWLRNLYFLQICCTLLKFAGRNCRSVKVFDIWSRCKVLPGPAVKACCFQFTEQSSQDRSHHHHCHHYHQYQQHRNSQYLHNWHLQELHKYHIPNRLLHATPVNQGNRIPSGQGNTLNSLKPWVFSKGNAYLQSFDLFLFFIEWGLYFLILSVIVFVFYSLHFCSPFLFMGTLVIVFVRSVVSLHFCSTLLLHQALWVDSSNGNCLICKRLTRKCWSNWWSRWM